MKLSSQVSQVPLHTKAAITPRNQAAAQEAPQGDSVELGVSRHEIPGSYIAVSDRRAPAQLDGVNVEKVLGQAGDSTFMLVSGTEANLDRLAESGTQLLPNFQYEGKLFDEPVGARVLGTAAEAGRPGHLDIIHIDDAWAVTKGKGALGAITDTGVDTKHPALQGTFWHNAKEIAGNGVDDDKNGYVDDTIGWDVSNNDNNPHETGAYHHTHVHGIVLANEGTSGATGVAPQAEAMALQISGGSRGYSSAVVVESYLYAMNNGAKSINTSFNIDGFVGDKAIENTYRALADHDVLVFNSAGNSGEKDSARSKFEDVVLVGATETQPGSVDKRASFSNYGQGVDVAAPGKDIVATLPNGKVGSLSGTSMASPGAMGVDLLVQAAHPDWNRNQRWAQIAGTADSIDAQNPDMIDQLGAGRINAGRALTETVAPPTISVKETKGPNGGAKKLTVRFDKVLDPTSANDAKAWQVLNEQGEVVMQGAPKEVRLLTNQLEFNVGSLPAGKYELVGNAEVLKDPFGQALDGNRDGSVGGNSVTAFEVK